MTSFRFETVDVFTKVRFGGNQLAVFADARGLSAGDMQRIASEFNYSEVTFVTPPSNPANTAAVRIFTPAREIPFAGHPNVGTAFALGRAGSVFGRRTGDSMRFEEGAGLVEVDLIRDGAEIVGARFRAPGPYQRGVDVGTETVALCASLSPGDFLTTRHPPAIASVGLPFAIAELRSVESLGRAAPNAAAFAEARRRYQPAAAGFPLFLYTRLPGGPPNVRARMFAPLSKILEDPAMGSASAALGGLLAALDPRQNARLDVSIEQGIEMGRPSSIEVHTRKVDSAVADVVVAGTCVPVMQGTLTV
jgi:trans-2,3-dihydro-3-hydroxyanthranilate isomerase